MNSITALDWAGLLAGGDWGGVGWGVVKGLGSLCLLSRLISQKVQQFFFFLMSSGVCLIQHAKSVSVCVYENS